MNDLKTLYQEVILDHSKKPRNFHALEHHSHAATGHNPLCGDNLKVFVRVENGIIQDVSFVGDGCAISKGKSIEEFQPLSAQFHQVATTQEPIPADFGKLQVLAGVRDYPSRVKCATLAWHTLDAALHHQDSAKTE